MSASVIVINLDRSPDRWAAFRAANENLIPYERFSARDGQTLDRAELERDGIIVPGLAYTPGALGNAASHVALWRRATASNEPLTICEDDAIFNKNFAHWRERLLTQLAGNFDIVLWGWNFDSTLTYEFLPGVSRASVALEQDNLRRALDKFQRLDFPPAFHRLDTAFGLPCYTLSPTGAANLLKLCLPLSPVSAPFPGYAKPLTNIAVDIAMSAQYPKLKALVSIPPLVVTPNIREISTVQPRGETKKGASG